MIRRTIAVLAVTLATLPLAAQAVGHPERAVVRIVNYAQRSDAASPWHQTQVVSSSGSGFVVDGGLVMTNAHVVSDSRLLLIYPYNDPTPLEAEVVHVAHDCDLALIRPLREDALAGVAALELGRTPPLGSEVDTLGYPLGGAQISSTRGIVSRIEPLLYVHSGNHVHLGAQTDAAINPGASGGPVVRDGRVVGVAFQAALERENVGFFIPPEVIRRFLTDVEDGRYDGYPELGVEIESMQNPADRARAGLDPAGGGVRVFRIFPGSSADGVVRPGDIVLEVDGRPVAADGTVADGAGRLPFGLLVDRMQIGRPLELLVSRDGRQRRLEVALRGYPYLGAHGNSYDSATRYYLYAGLLFLPLDVETLSSYGPDWRRTAPKELLHEFLIRPFGEPELRLDERVVLRGRLKHPVNADMAWFRDQVVERVNGQRIGSLEDLVRAFEAHDGDQHVIEFATARRFCVLDRERAERANPEILERYGIPRDRNL